MSNNNVPDPGEVTQGFLQEENTGDIGISLDMDRETAPLRPLHGICNYAPTQNIGFVCRVSIVDAFREMKIPCCYLHDCVFDNPGWDLVDVSRIFPIFTADENDPANYRFEETDIYLKQIVDAGTEIIFRLGESIEVIPGKRLRVQPPADFEKWANICINIARHYNEGWADGFHWNIRHWAIWEEPNNPNLWGGTFEEYLRLYETTAVKFKKAFPDLLIGGPQTTTLGIRFLDQFLAFCREKQLPLDFVGYTAYYHTPAELLAETFRRRQMMDRYGFKDIPMCINEWHASPYWESFKDPVGYVRENDRVCGFDGAVFAGTVLCGLQDTPVARACYYEALSPGGYGIFDVRRMPTPQYYLFDRYCTMFNNAKGRIAVDFDCDEPNVKALAVINEAQQIDIMIGCYLQKSRHIDLAFPAGYKVGTVEMLNKDYPNFMTLKPWEYTVDGSTIGLYKTEEPALLHVTIIPC